jgi:ATP-dependent Clp protease ATP-binding subunit ClpA/post-segregation antitoxin (ccd killing protein)
MPKINVYLPDDLANAVRDAGVPVSAVCQRALESAVRRITVLREVIADSQSAVSYQGPVAENFTRRAGAVLESAQRRAGPEPAAQVGTEHMLFALIAAENMAVHVLGALDISPGQVRAELQRRTGPAAAGEPGPDPAEPSPGGPAGLPGPPLARQAATALELAANESSALGNHYIGCEHLLLGLIAEEDGIAGSVLRSLGADLRLTRRAVAAALAGWTARGGWTPPGAARPANAPPGTAAAPAPADMSQLTAVLRAELTPVLARIERLEGLAGNSGEQSASAGRKKR